MTSSSPQRRPTMNDIARDAGVSLKTVSRVVNRVASVDPEMTDRVLASIRRLDYRRNDLAANLRSGTETRTIGFVTADLQNAFYTPIATALGAVASTRGFHLITASSDEDPDVERITALDLCQRRVSALVVVPTSGDHGYLAPDVASGVPVVFVDRPGSGLLADEVLLDNGGGAASAIRDLIDRGHHRIGLLLDKPEIHTMRERLVGAEKALAAGGLALDPALVSYSVHVPEDVPAALSAMLALDDPPTAVFCGNNRALIGAVEYVWHAGIHLQISGFDDFETSRLLPLQVTIVGYDAAELGRTAAGLIFDRLDGDDSPPHRVLLPTELLVRGGVPSAASLSHP